MPISTSSFGDEHDEMYSDYESSDSYPQESMEFPGLTPVQAETILKRLGGGVEEKLKRVEGIGWKATIDPTTAGVQITFAAHDELMDDLIRRFEEWVEREDSQMTSSALTAHRNEHLCLPIRRVSASRLATARAGSNIAFIKYWGVSDPTLNLPLSNSISMTLADAYTTTSVDWDSRGNLAADEITVDGKRMEGKSAERIIRHLNRMRTLAEKGQHARVVSLNNFPMASGIASSASGFAALTVAGCAALQLDLSPTQLSALARQGSGSASRSIFGGFVEWEKGRDDTTSVARQIQPPDHWSLLDIVAVVSAAEKPVSSESGHLLAATSPFNAARIDTLDMGLTEVRSAIATCDIERLGRVIERDALAMHAIMMTSVPNLIYWQPGTIDVIHAVRRWREQERIPVYFTIDAGPNVHMICESAYRVAVTDRVRALKSVEQVIVSKPGREPQLMDTHLV